MCRKTAAGFLANVRKTIYSTHERDPQSSTSEVAGEEDLVKMKTQIPRAVATITLALMAGGVHAQAATNLKEVSTNISTQLVALGSLAGIAAFLTGFVFGIMGFMKLKANASNPNDPSNKVSTGFMLIFIGAGLIAVPTVMGVGIGSIFGVGGQNTELSTSSQPFTAIK